MTRHSVTALCLLRFHSKFHSTCEGVDIHFFCNNLGRNKLKAILSSHCPMHALHLLLVQLLAADNQLISGGGPLTPLQHLVCCIKSQFTRCLHILLHDGGISQTCSHTYTSKCALFTHQSLECTLCSKRQTTPQLPSSLYRITSCKGVT